jgi:DNA polymerase/3'-5' exonuclease PolX
LKQSIRWKVYAKELNQLAAIDARKAKVHDIDFVVPPSDKNWKEMVQVLKRSKATISCAGNAVIKALYPYDKMLFKVDFYRAKPSTFGITGSAEHNMWLAGMLFQRVFG